MHGGRDLLRDKALVGSVLAAPVFWAALRVWGHGSLDATWPFRAPIFFFSAAVVYPVLEEIVFRGVVQPFFLRFQVGKKRWQGFTLANIGASAVFAVAHLVSHSPPWAAATFLPSLVFGYFRDRDGSLRIPIALHIYYNAGYFLLFSGAPSGS